jgi:UPF0271 protein
VRTVDLNADVGEYHGEEEYAVERALLGLVTSAHVACGGHAGDESSMHATVAAAVTHSVRVGAHPSYPDRAGFGRRVMAMPADQLAVSLREQIGALAEVAAACGTTVRSVKAHGALYAEVARGEAAYAALLGAMRSCSGPDTALVLPAGAPAVRVAWDAGVPVLEEGFCDRAYTADGGLLARDEPGAVHDDPARAAAQAVGLARDGTVAVAGGRMLHRHVDTLCLHSDTPGVVALAAAVRDALERAGIGVVAAPRRA